MGTFIQHSLAKATRMFWPEVFEARVTFALVAIVGINTLSILMTVVQMRKLAFVDQLLTISSRILVLW
jgi:hypothetical protein